MLIEEDLKKLGFVEPKTEKRFFKISHWSENLIPDDYVYSIDSSVDNLEAAPNTTIYVLAKYAGSFILEEGGQLIAPKLNVILLFLLKVQKHTVQI